jgi:hypothetical protein
MNDKTKDPFARWWWPGQWLHIVYGVWIDQLWYWQNIRPLLTKVSREQRRSLIVQGALGAMLISLVALIPVSGILFAAAMPVNWGLLLICTIAGVIVEAGISMFPLDLDKSLPWMATGGSLLGLCLGILVSVGRTSINSVIAPSAFSLAAWLGGKLGLNSGITSGRRSNPRLSIGLWVLLLTAYSIFMQFVLAGILMGILMGIIIGTTYILGNRWATRQVQDNLTREHLADPDHSR